MTSSPATVEELQQSVRGAQNIYVRGGGTKSRRADASTEIDLRRLNGIIDYSPEECVFTALAGTPLDTIVTALSAHGQYLPFDPPFVADGATIGGSVASGVSGPRRYRYGGVRDFVIGVRVVDGEGRHIRSGGKVVKNAAGFLLHHGIVGSCGRFGVVSEVTCKVFPAPETRRTVTIESESAEAAFIIAKDVERLRVDCESIDFDDSGSLHVTIAGRAASIDARVENLTRAIGTPSRIQNDGPSPTSFSAYVDQQFSSLVKVAGLMKCWPKLRRHVTNAHFMCAGSVAWLTTFDLSALDRILDEECLAGQVIGGRSAGARVGSIPHNEFEERVRHVLDPHNRFSATPHSNQ